MKKLLSILLLCALLFLSASCMFEGETKDPQKIDLLNATGKASVLSSITEEAARENGIYLAERRVSFAATGDNLIHPQIFIDARNRKIPGGRDYNFKPTYEKVASIIADADISFINQETLMAGARFGYTGYPYFNSPQELGLDLVELGFDVVNIANNHMLDQKSAGLSSTIDFWNSTSATMIGGYKNEADFNNIRVIEKNGIKIAFLAFTEHTNYIKLDAGSELVIPYIDTDNDGNIESYIKNQVNSAKALADIVIVSMHWGDEYVQTPNAKQQGYAKQLADCEVDVILGDHSHSIQPIVELDRPSGKKTLCIYSLGNFVSGMAEAVNMAGGIFTFDIVKPEVGDTRIENVLFIPTVCHFGPIYYNSYVYLLENYTDDLAKIHGIQVYGNKTSVAELTKFVTDAIDSKYLPDYLK